MGSFLSDTFFKAFSSTVNMFISIIMIQIATAYFLVIAAETTCWEIEENSPIFNEDFYLLLYLPLWYEIIYVSQWTVSLTGYLSTRNIIENGRLALLRESQVLIPSKQVRIKKSVVLSSIPLKKRDLSTVSAVESVCSPGLACPDRACWRIP